MLTSCEKIGFLFAIFILLAGCKGENQTVKNDVSGADCLDSLFNTPADDSRSELYRVGEACGKRVAVVRSIIGDDTLQQEFALDKPLKRVVVLSSAQIGYMLNLGLEDRIVAVGDGNYIADSSLYMKVKSGEIAEVGNGNSLDFEKLIALKPDLVMTFATGGSEDDFRRLQALGISMMVTSEWQEDSPLRKLDWILLFGELFGDEAKQRANAYKLTQIAAYDSLVSADSRSACPKVLAGMSHGGVWYAPGGKSYTARLIKDAGGCYLWASDTTRELRLTIEEVMTLADSADVWVNPGMFASPEEILAAEPRAAFIKAFKDKRVYQNDGRKGPGGGNDFFESAVAHPVELVSNLKSLILEGGTLSDTVKRPVSNELGFTWYRNIF